MVIIHPLIPLAEDGLSHFFAEAYHIATVHAIYGNNHLEEQEAAASGSNSNEKNMPKEEITISVHITVTEPLCVLNTISIFKSYFVVSNSCVTKIFQSVTIPPPKYLIL